MNQILHQMKIYQKGLLCTAIMLFLTSYAFSQVSVTLQGTNPMCGGFATGSITAYPSGGWAPYTYYWSNGATTQTINNLIAGFYSVTVTDIDGAIATKSITLTAPTEVTGDITISGNNAPFTLTAQGSGGVLPYTYEWDTGQTGSTIHNATNGTYCVTIVDNNLCGTVECINVAGCNVNVVITVQHVSCPGANDGTARAIVSGGVGPFTYQWDNGGTTQTITGLSQGVYMVTVTDSNGCTGNDSGLVSGPGGMINLHVSGTNPSCGGSSNGTATANATGGVGPYTFNWSNGQSGSTITGLTAGTYYVTMTDANGCQQTGNITLVNQGSLNLSVSSSNAVCQGSNTGSASAFPSGGSQPYSYNWSNGGTTQTINNLGPGTYTVTVTDNGGCSQVRSTTINSAPQLYVNATSTGGGCGSGGNGTATANTSGGSAPYSYQWSNGGTTQTINNLGPGTYTVTVTDNGGCSGTGSVTINNGVQITGDIAKQDVTCFGGNDGNILVSGWGGTPLYTYAWSTGFTETEPAPNAGSELVNLPAGTYSVTITDANGCSTVGTIILNQPPQLFVNANGNDANCGSNGGGSASASASGGTPPYSYNWSNGGTGQTITNLSSGSYTVTVTDANYCTKTATVVINSSGQINADLAKTNVSCFGGNDGTILATGWGGTAPYTFSLNNGQILSEPFPNSGVTFSNLSAGTYTVTVIDANGCSDSSSITIGQPTRLFVSANGNDANCGSNGGGSATASASGGTPPYNYNWSNGGTGQTITNLSSGSYTVTVTDANYCTKTATVVINSSGQINADLAKTNVSCFGGNDGTILATGWGGTAPYTFFLNTGQTLSEPFPNSGVTFSNLSAGTYTVTVTDANGCTDSSSITIGQPTQLIVNATDYDANCGSNGGGSASASASGGTPPYSYNWSNGQSGQTITNLDGGFYTVTVTDANGCSRNATVNVAVNGQINADLAKTNVSCFGGNDGTIIATGWGGTAPYTFFLNTGQTLTEPFPNSGVTFSNLSAGTYTVTVTDANGCTDSSSITIGQPSQLIVSTSGNDANCGSSGGGSASASASGGTPPYSYNWSNGGTGQTITNLTSGSYTVTVTDANYCTKTGTVFINSSGQINADIAKTNVTCFGGNDGTIIATGWGGTAPYTFSLNNGQFISEPFPNAGVTFTNLNAGTYTVTVRDANGCTASSTAIIGQPAQLIVSATGTDAGCGSTAGSASASASGGTPPYSYNWSNGGNGQTITNIPAGTYTVTVTDANYCTKTASVTINGGGQVNVDVITTHVTCYQQANGTILATGWGGTAPYKFKLNAGSFITEPFPNSGVTFSNLSNGTYTVMLIDANGCTGTTTVVINQPPQFVANATSTNASCNANDGTALAMAGGGTPPYSYQWNTGATSQTLNNLGPGTYVVTVTDANGCTAASTTNVTQAQGFTINVTSTGTSCANSGTASATATPNGGAAPFSYSWSNGGTTQTITNLNPGTYSVVVTDANGCTATGSTIVVPGSDLTTDIAIHHVNCFGGSDGSVLVSGWGGTPLYTYEWSTGLVETETTPNGGSELTGLTAGTYTVTVTDAVGCTVIETIIINQPPQLVVNTSGTNASCDNNSGSANANATGGTPPYSYNWSNGVNTPTNTNLTPGVYTVTVTDANYCTATSTVTINAGGGFTISVTGTDVLCHGNNTGTATVTTNGGNAPFSYQWSNGGTTSTINNLSSGTYSVTVTDNSGCSEVGSVIISQSSNLNVNVTGNNTTCGASNSGTAVANVTGGTAPYSYSWSNGSNASSISGLAAGTYTVTVTDTNGCTDTGSIVITGSNLNINVVKNNVTCFDGNDGSATINVTGGNAPYTYSWSNGSTSSTVTNLTAGTYTVTVTDANGCTSTATVIITQPPSLVVSITPSHPGCSGSNTGSATATASGGTPAYAYSWSNGASGATISNLSAGTYTVTVTDANGCTKTATTTINQGATLTLNISSTPTTCAQNNGTATVTANGTAPYTYIWSNGGTTATISNLSAGNYTVTVTDSNGCSNTASTTVSSSSDLTLNTSSTPATCGQSNGTATVTANGTAPYTYNWSNGGTTVTISSLSAGTYTVTVTDSNGCSDTATVTVSGQDSPNVTVTTSGSVCSGTSTGTATANASGGQAPYTYMWSNGETSMMITDLDAGTYIVTVTDSNGCMDIASGSINTAPGLQVNVNTVDIACFGDNDGTASASASGGTAPYTYMWSNGSTNANQINLSAGTYTVTVTDANGCTGTGSGTVDEPSQIVVNLQKSNETCGGASDGSITATVNGGTPNYSYAWSNGANSATIQNLSPGSYTVTVTDSNGCTQTATAVISAGSSLSVNVTTQATCQGASNGSATANVTGGQAPFTYSWSNGRTGQSINNLSSGTYSVTVTDANGCQGTDSANVSAAAGPLCYIQIISPVTDGNDGVIQVQASGGQSPYSYSWSNGQTTQTISGLSAGTYLVTVTDANGCTTTCNVTLSNPAKLGDMVWNDYDQDGIMDAGEPGIGGVQVVLSGTDSQGNSISGTTFTDGAGKYLFTGLAPGTYKVTFTLGLTGFLPSPANQGGNDEIDSDANTSTGMTQFVTLTEGECDLSLDAGFYELCVNVTNPGSIGFDQDLCISNNDPDPIISLAPASGGQGAIEYIWMRANLNVPFTNSAWEIIPGATGESYDPGPINQSTYFARCARSEGCNNYIETNVVYISISNIAAIINGPDRACQDVTYNYFASVASGADISYTWNFGANAVPATATDFSANVRWTTTGVKQVTLTTTLSNGCSHTSTQSVSVTTLNSVCGDALVIDATVVNRQDVMVEWKLPLGSSDSMMYYVERSADGEDFHEMGQMLDPKEELFAMEYEFMDLNPKMGYGYYRVGYDDEFGVRHYSNIAEVIVYSDDIIHVFPNPTFDDINIEILDDYYNEVSIEVVDVLGRYLQSTQLGVDVYKTSVDLSTYPKGIYFLKINYSDVDSRLVKVIKR